MSMQVAANAAKNLFDFGISNNAKDLVIKTAVTVGGTCMMSAANKANAAALHGAGEEDQTADTLGKLTSGDKAMLKGSDLANKALNTKNWASWTSAGATVAQIASDAVLPEGNAVAGVINQVSGPLTGALALGTTAAGALTRFVFSPLIGAHAAKAQKSE